MSAPFTALRVLAIVCAFAVGCAKTQGDVVTPVAIPTSSLPAPIASARAPSKPVAAPIASVVAERPITWEKPITGDPVGAHAPGFTLALRPGPGKVTLLGNQVAIIHFWATWCEPCKKSFDVLEHLHEKYGNDVLVIAISVDDEPTDIAQFARDRGAQFPVAWDEGHSLATKYRVQVMPETFVIGRDGIVRFVQPGYHAGDDVPLEQAVDGLL